MVWSSLISIPAGCPDPSVENGQKGSTKGPFCDGDKVVFTCDAGYELEGDSTVKCTNGQFNSQRPRYLRNMACSNTTSHHLSTAVNDLATKAAEFPN